MKLNTASAPHIRHSESTRGLMGDAIMTMLILYVMAAYYHGFRALALMIVSVAAASITDALCMLAGGKKPNTRDYSAMVTGMILPLLMPSTIDYWIVILAAVFGIAVAKHPFGGTGHNVFNPAAAGLAFAVISFPDKLFTYPMPMQRISTFGGQFIPTNRVAAFFLGNTNYSTGVSPAYTLELGGTPTYDLVSMALGNFPGPMGATNIVVILTCLLYLVSRNTVRWVTPFCFFAATAAFAFLFPRIGGGDLTFDVRLNSIAYEIMSGSLLFGGVFLLGDPVTAPKRQWSKAAWAVTAGIAVMMFRRFGNFEEEIPFAVLFMNATVWLFDMVGERIASRIRRKKIETVDGKTIQVTAPNA